MIPVSHHNVEPHPAQHSRASADKRRRRARQERERTDTAAEAEAVSVARSVPVLALRAAALSPFKRWHDFWADRPWMERPAICDLAPLRKVA